MPPSIRRYDQEEGRGTRDVSAILCPPGALNVREVPPLCPDMRSSPCQQALKDKQRFNGEIPGSIPSSENSKNKAGRSQCKILVHSCLGKRAVIRESLWKMSKLSNQRWLIPLNKYFYSSKSKPLFLITVSWGSKNSTEGLQKFVFILLGVRWAFWSGGWCLSSVWQNFQS